MSFMTLTLLRARWTGPSLPAGTAIPPFDAIIQRLEDNDYYVFFMDFSAYTKHGHAGKAMANGAFGI
jgi:hypothetical protein